MNLQSVKTMWTGAIDSKPVNFDFNEGYCETWEVIHPKLTEELAIEKDYNPPDDLPEDPDERKEAIEEWLEDIQPEIRDSNLPAMNYYYPLPASYGPEDAAKITGCLTIVNFTEENTYGLALVGGGQDLSWEICETFMELGYLPPLHFIDLPHMAGYTATKKRLWILAGAKQAVKTKEDELTLHKHQIKEMREYLNNNK